MLILAGCSDQAAPALTDTQTPSDQVTPQSTSMPTATPESSATFNDTDDGPAPDQNLSQYSNELGTASAGLNKTEQQRVQNLVVGFYDSVENESERREALLNTSERMCGFDRQYDGEARAATLEDGGKTADNVIRRAHYAADIANEFNDDVPVQPLVNFRSKTGDLTKYAPLFGSYNLMADKACVAAEQRSDAAIREYQIAVVMFGVDAMLVSTGAFYRPAFAGTRFTANKASQLGLYRLRYLCGNRCWALGMSEVHVALRGSMLTATSTVVRQSAEMGVNLSQEDLEAIADAHDTDAATLLDDTNITVSNGTVEAVSDNVVECGQEVLQGNETTDKSDNDGLFGGDSVDAGDVVNKSQDVVNESQQAIEDCNPGDG